MRIEKKASDTVSLKNSKEEDPGSYRLVSLISAPGKVTEQSTPEIMSRHMKDKKVIVISQHGFTKKEDMLDQSDSIL